MVAGPAPRVRSPHQRRLRRRHALSRAARKHARLGEFPQPDGRQPRGQQGDRRGGRGGGRRERRGRRRRRERGGGRRDAGRVRAADEERPHPAPAALARRAVGHEVLRSGLSLALLYRVARKHGKQVSGISHPRSSFLSSVLLHGIGSVPVGQLCPGMCHVHVARVTQYGCSFPIACLLASCACLPFCAYTVLKG